MLYLFNGGYSGLYRANVLRTLFLPTGCENKYRYRLEGASYRNVDRNLQDRIADKDLGRLSVVVIFNDRFFPAGYQYHALRKGRLLKHPVLENDYLHFTVQLGDYISADPKALTERIKNRLDSHNPPTLTSGNPTNRDDGNYAILDDDDSISDLLNVGDAEWSTTVRAIGGTKAFSTESDQHPVFARVKIKDQGAEVRPKRRHESIYFDLKRGRKYTFDFAYYYPAAKSADFPQTRIELDAADNIRLSGGNFIRVNAHQDTRELPFSVKRLGEEVYDGIRFSSPDLDTQKAEVVGPEADIQVHASNSAATILQLWSAILLFTLSDSEVFDNLSATIAGWGPPPLLEGLIMFFTSSVGEVLLQTVALLWLLRLLGKKAW